MNISEKRRIVWTPNK